ncbi:hypothetical protein H4219_006396, partial [Mycoemilia scoparia]
MPLDTIMNRTKNELEKGDKEYSLNGPCICRGFKMFDGPLFFALDEMHLIGYGISKSIWKMVVGSYGKKLLFLDNTTCKEISKIISNSKSSIPTTFHGYEKNINNQSGYLRAVDWIDFLLHVVLTIVVGLMDNIEDCMALMCLVKACSLIQKWHITEKEIDIVEKLIRKWNSHLKLRHDQEKVDISLFTISHHYLTHVPEIIRHYGPLRNYSSRSLERTIGEYSDHFKSKSKPGPHAGNILHRISMMNSYNRKSIDIGNNEEYIGASKIIGSQDICTLGLTEI